MSRRVLVLTLVGLLLTAAVSTQVGATNGDGYQIATVSYSASYEPTVVDNGSVTATLRMVGTVDPRDTEHLYVVDHHWMRVQSTTGFDRSGNRLVWDGQTPRPTFTYTVDINQVGRDAVTGGTTEHGVTTQRFVTADVAVGTSSWPRTVTGEVTIDGPGIAAGEYLWFGNVTRYTRETANGPVTLAVPDTISFRDAVPNGSEDRYRRGAIERFDHVDVLDALVAASEYLPRDDDHVTILVIPPAFGPTDIGGQAVDNGAVVKNGQRLSTYIHEYAHTTQGYPWRPEDGVRWTREGGATFAEADILHQYGFITYDEYRDRVRAAHHGAVLANGSEKQDYTKGAHVFAALDARIRDVTNGERSVRDVFARLNDYDRSFVTNEAFLKTVASVSDEATAAWLRPYIFTEAAPTVPHRPDLYAEYGPAPNGTDPRLVDTDDDGVSDYRERADLDTNPHLVDTDGDGLTDGREAAEQSKTDPSLADTDYDGLDDGRELSLGTAPARQDTDNDGIPDGEEVERGLDPRNVDTDADGEPDATDTFPLDPDSDDDGFLDGEDGWTGEGTEVPGPMHSLLKGVETGITDVVDTFARGFAELVRILGALWRPARTVFHV